MCARVCEGVGVPRGVTIWSTRPSFFALSALTFFPVRAMSRASGRPTFVYVCAGREVRGRDEMQYSLSLRGRVNNFTINYLLYIKCLILLVVQSITAKLDIQVLYGKYYLCNKS